MFFDMEPKFIGKAKLTKSGQLTLPQEARKDLSIPSDTDLFWYEINDALILVKTLVNPSEISRAISSKKKKRN